MCLSHSLLTTQVTMPQCLSPQFESKSPAIVELLSSTVQEKSSSRDKLSEYELACSGLFGKLDHYSHHHNDSNRVLSVNKPLTKAELWNRKSQELDDYVYLEFFVDTIKPEYASLSSTNVTFTNCVNNFKLTNGMIISPIVHKYINHFCTIRIVMLYIC